MKFCTSAFVLWFLTCLPIIQLQALEAGYQLNTVESTLDIVVQWQSHQNVLVVQPVFVEKHPLGNQKILKIAQSQNNDLNIQRFSFRLDRELKEIPEASIKIIRDGKEELIRVPNLPLEKTGSKLNFQYLLGGLFLIISLITLIALRSRKQTTQSPEPCFSREAAVEAIKRGNWSLLFEILSSDVSWKTELDGIPWQDWEQQWRFASRRMSDRDCELLVKTLQKSLKYNAEEESTTQEDEILQRVLNQ